MFYIQLYNDKERYFTNIDYMMKVLVEVVGQSIVKNIWMLY